MLTRMPRFIGRDVLPLCAFVLCACATLFPLLMAFDARILGWAGGDGVQYVYMTGRVAEALRIGQLPLTDPLLNYPGTLWLPATDAPFLSMVLAAPIVWLTTPVAGYNAILFVSALCSGYFTYLWLLRLTGSRFAGLIAGITFMLLPFRIVHSYGHLQLASTQALPLFFWCLDELLRRPPPEHFAISR
jgi:hypothetical protein